MKKYNKYKETEWKY